MGCADDGTTPAVPQNAQAVSSADFLQDTNPNVNLDDVPDLSDADLTVQANPNVIAAVSTNGGYALARSGDITVISGPDGPRIISTPAGSTPTPPSNNGNSGSGDNSGNTDDSGGNNNVDMVS